MSLITGHLKLALIQLLIASAPLACHSQKSEMTQAEEPVTETLPEASPTRDNRSVQSSDTAFIKIYPDGDATATRDESVSAPEAGSVTPVPGPTSSPTPADSQQEAPAPTADPTPSTSANETATPAPGEETSDSVPTPAASEEPTVTNKETEDTSRPVLAVNESSASQLIAILPKENKATVSIGQHSDFMPGAYVILAKWTIASKKLSVKVASERTDLDCAVNGQATEGDWKTLGIFYLTKNAKVVITNSKNSFYAVKNELLLKPVIAENLTEPSSFKCLGGQIDGHGLVGFR